MKKLIIGLVLAAVCGGVGITAWAKTSNGKLTTKTIGVQPANNNINNNIKSEIENYLNNKYGSDWAINLYNKNGEKWDDILENELETQFGHIYEDIIDHIIDAKESHSGLDIDIDHNYDYYDDDQYDDNDRYDD
ncbi:hypothetical protein [Clostridium celatum]|uniref:Uncharacterized protein n=1 Tax=Clostridium celatum DSM 1785 TaxID=545697 RepID=L1QPD4_9CLOT|nr:hypothetical protein [Clostridium celatum]EKY29781.1 hypothetical protein HMPREF0216_00025 [Clostridium celatum DSM 1785]MCE9654821.1 hypothetical protein [Clostridium celatum]MDU2265081.1 hypothetical protein [Clostridium celatum]MDU6294573.1 hypothetical protein [Clostridium celatum]MDY3361022.1 hypothetical protein [Clostridium celatum]